jgi:predicted GNAT family N-acyltransferase
MKSFHTILFLTITVVTSLLQCCETPSSLHGTIAIRPATRDDLDAMSAISKHYYLNDFTQLWTKHYAPMLPSNHNINQFVQEKMVAADIINENFITKQDNKQNCRLLVAEIANSDTQKKIAGYCRFEKKDAQSMYINFIVVNEAFRQQGLAKQLGHAAMNTFDGVTQCNFRALAHNDFINDLYTTHGCINKGTISLDPDTGKISTDPTAPITHIDYTFKIKK